MEEFELFWNHLTEEAKQEIRERAEEVKDEDFLNGGNGNYDVVPIATIYIGSDD